MSQLAFTRSHLAGSSSASPVPATKLDFLLLPEEIHVEILSELCVPDLLVCSRTCKQLYFTFLSSIKLQYAVELYAAGYIDLPGRLTAAQRSAVLQAHTDSWNSLTWERQETVPMTPSIWPGWKSDLRDGIYAEVEDRRVALLRLPSARDEAELICLQEMTDEVDAVLIDPQQDLLVIFTRTADRSCVNVSLRTFDGATHPQSVTDFEYRQTWHGDFPGVRLLARQLSGDLVAAMLLSFKDRVHLTDLVMWNWKTGTIHTTYRCDDQYYENFYFLSLTAFLMCDIVSKPMTIDIFTFSHSEPGSKPQLVRSFALPTLADNINCNLLIVPNKAALSPSMSPASGSRSARSQPSELPFAASPDLRTVAIILRPSEVIGRVVQSATYTMFVPVSILLDASPFIDAARPNRLGKMIIPWHQWGPLNTRWVEHPEGLTRNIHGPNFIHGTRAIFSSPSKVEGAVHYRLVDFNPLAVKRAQSGQDATDLSQVVPGPSIIFPSPFWTHRIETSLPYREILTKKTFETPFWIFLDQERIIAVKREAQSGAGANSRNVLDVLVL